MAKKRKSEGPRSSGLPTYMAYALPEHDGRDSIVIEQDKFDLHDVPLGAPESFLDYQGIVLFAGTFEALKRDGWIGRGGTWLECIAPDELLIRERQFWSALQQDRVVVFLVPPLRTSSDNHTDLLRKVMHNMSLHLSFKDAPISRLRSLIPEFCAFIEKYGTAQVSFSPRYGATWDEAEFICETRSNVYGFGHRSKLFILPCAVPRSHEEAIDMAVTALRGVIAYRERTNTAYPAWVGEFRFNREVGLRKEADDVRQQLLVHEAEIEVYEEYKGLLCLRSNPLVERVIHVLKPFFNIEVVSDEKCIEDGTICDAEGNIQAVMEIKGVNGNFRRKDISQVDSHRERLGLPPRTPGILIMNTFMDVDSLDRKDQPPHPDIIHKALADHVIIMRTLDLLRYADLVDSGVLDKDGLHGFFLQKAGWLRVQDGQAEVLEG